MSAKIAVIIGDYSNGWSDAIIVQDVGGFSQKDLPKDRRGVLALMQNAMISVIEGIEKNEIICPVPQDSPCCQEFEKQSGCNSWYIEAICCPFCGKKITEERRKKYFK